MKLNDSDTLRLGASSRLYRLNWVPLSSAYDLDKPFMPQLDAADTIEEDDDEVMDQDENSLSYRNDHVETLSENMEGLEVLFSNEDLGSSIQKVSPTAPLVAKDLNNSFSNDEEAVNNSSPGICSQENELFSSQPCQFEKENSTPKAVSTETSGMNSDKISGLSIWSRRGKPESVKIETSRSRGSYPRINMTSQIIPLKSTNNSKMYQYEPLLPTLDKAGQHRQVLQEWRPISHGRSKKQPVVLKARADRDPFNPLSVNSTSNKNKAISKPSVHEDTERGSRSINCPDWIQVHHSHKSRKELQLLQGLRGTTLVIPRIVVRELDCMLRRGSFFTRMTEVSAALQWIEECMAVAKWWIHIQSSADESQLIPPTPPASPHWSSEDKDHILECALFFKQTRKNGQLVLLSDDVTLKIKAMAETWGPTWSCVDDVVLKEKYYPSPSKKLSKSGEGAKGLKLILLHNSKFRQINPVSPKPLAAENRSLISNLGSN
ncbi:UNVERIFIED_CONTAM: FHA domain-containing protein PS1 [Sesamum calycinum]|uniref:FHA domain-containing protein PS1 n=1 Tax=Sesamum calycinum TaxID=2727403 RepID=A0AAW2P986_9LAMI